MSDIELETTIGGKRYRIGRLSAFDAMHLIGDFREIITAVAMLKRDRPKEMTDKEYQNTVRVIVASTGLIPPDVRDRAWSMCMRTILRQEPAGWSPILASPGQLQYADISPNQIADLLYAVFEHNKLFDFFFEGLSDSGPKTTDGTTQA